VKNVEVNIVSAQAFQGTFDSAQNILASVPACVWVAGFGVVAKLGSNNDALAQLYCDELTKPGFAGAICV